MKVDLSLIWSVIGIPKPQEEYKFHSDRKWRFDFAWPDSKIAVEIEGGFYGKGRKCPLCGRRKVAGHTSIERLKSDKNKYNEAALLGWRVFRFTPDDFKNGFAADFLKPIFLIVQLDGNTPELIKMSGGG